MIGDDLTPRVAEAVPVVLARMEGKLDIVNFKVDDLVPRVSRLEDRSEALEKGHLILSKNMDANEATKVALALALKEAEENRRNQSEQSWTPIQRFMAILASVVGAVTLAIYLYSTIHG